MKPLIALLLSVWLAFGQLAGALAQSADMPCESMSMATPANDCCGEGMDPVKCLNACAASAAATIAPLPHVSPPTKRGAVVPRLIARHPDISGPPDIVPPKSFLS